MVLVDIFRLIIRSAGRTRHNKESELQEEINEERSRKAALLNTGSKDEFFFVSTSVMSAILHTDWLIRRSRGQAKAPPDFRT